MAETSTALPTPTCPYCGSMPHAYWAHCPRIYAITYFDDSYKSVQRVEFYEPHPTTSDALAEARAVIEPFAKIAPSSFFASDGSEAEPYRVINATMADLDFTGAHLRAARAWLDKWRLDPEQKP